MLNANLYYSPDTPNVDSYRDTNNEYNNKETAENEEEEKPIIKCPLILKAIKLFARIILTLIRMIEKHIDSPKQRLQINEHVRR